MYRTINYILLILYIQSIHIYTHRRHRYICRGIARKYYIIYIARNFIFYRFWGKSNNEVFKNRDFRVKWRYWKITKKCWLNKITSKIEILLKSCTAHLEQAEIISMLRWVNCTISTHKCARAHVWLSYRRKNGMFAVVI